LARRQLAWAVGQGQCLAAVLLDAGDQVSQLVGPPCQHDNLRTRFGQVLGGGRADAAGRTGDDGDALAQPIPMLCRGECLSRHGVARPRRCLEWLVDFLRAATRRAPPVSHAGLEKSS
jgi:hypothetical protein